MAELTITVSGRDELHRALVELAQRASGSQIVTALEAGADIIINDAKQRAPYRTGTLRRSIHSERASVTESGAEVDLGPAVNYGAQVEFGGDIIPVRARRLRFVVNGEVIYARRVHQEPRPYMVPAAQENAGAVVQEITAALQALLRLG